LLPKVKLEMVVADSRVSPILEVLSSSAKTGKIGDGKIFVSTINDVIRIRNGDRGEGAL
jgi:nitrogen regulatory protein PII